MDVGVCATSFLLCGRDCTNSGVLQVP